MPVSELSPNEDAEGIRRIIWAMGVSHWMSDWGSNLSRKNLISKRIFLVMKYLFLEWWTSRAARFRANEMCLVWSFGEQAKEPVLKDWMMFLNTCYDSISTALLEANALAFLAYICVIKWCNHGAPSARCPSLPVSFWAPLTVNDLRPTCQVMSNSSRTLAT